jgi:predicted Zn-dependent protease
MRVPSFYWPIRSLTLLVLAAGFLDASLIQFRAATVSAQTSPAPQPARTNDFPANSAKKHRKYDVDRIGQREVGRGINLYSIHRERAVGERLANSIDHNTKLVNDAAVSNYINALAQKIVRNSDAEFAFTIKLVDSSDMGAFGLPGGFLYVDSGLVTALDAEAELASVMAHEIGHIAARHATRAVTRRRMWDIVSSVGLFAGPAGVLLQNAGGIGGPLSDKKFNRNAEYEADLLGIEYTYAAGYDPEAFVSALEKLHAHELTMQDMLAKVPGYHLATKLPFHKQIARSFSNYPLTEDRIHRLQEEISVFLPERSDYIFDTSEFRDVKARLLAADAPVLRRNPAGADPGKGPILRRASQ